LLIAIIAVATALYIFRIYPKVVLDLLVFTLVCGEIFVAGYNGIKAVGSTSTDNYPQGGETTEDVINAMNSLESNTTDMWRAEMTQTQTLNDSSLNDYNGVSQFSSMSNVSVTKFLEEFGCQGWQSGNRYTYRESTPITNLFLNLKYLISRDGSYATTDYMSLCYQSGSEVLLKNNYYLPMGFVTDKNLLNYTLEDRDPDDFSELNAIEKQNELFSLATGVDKDVMTIIEPAGMNTSDSENADVFINKQLPNSSHGYDFGISLSNAQQAANVNFIYNISEPGDYCVYSLYYGSSLDSKTVTIKKDGNTLQSGSDVSRPYIINAGNFEAGQQLTVALENLPVGTSTNFVCFVAKVNDDVFEEGYNKLAENTLTATKVTDTEIKGEIDSNRDGLFYTSIVYEDGWTVKVDGEKVDTKKVGGAMLAFDITEGTHTIEMTYTPSGYLLGSLASILGIVLLIAMAFLYRKYLSKTFLFKYKTHPDADPDRFEEEEEETTDISRFAHKSSEEKYLKGETPLVARIIFSVVFSFVYFPVWLAGIIKKIKILCEEEPTYVFDIVMSIIVPFYFIYVAYKYSKKNEKLATEAKLRITTNFSHTALELGATCGFIVSFMTFASNFIANFSTYLQETSMNQSIEETGGTLVERTAYIMPTGSSLGIFIFGLVAGVALRILNLYWFDMDIKMLADKKFGK
jgi:hypothetical protein